LLLREATRAGTSPQAGGRPNSQGSHMEVMLSGNVSGTVRA
jgi:hypothetical protein